MWARPSDNDRARVPGADGNPPYVSTWGHLDGHGRVRWAIVILLERKKSCRRPCPESSFESSLPHRVAIIGVARVERCVD
jgi:hypothetical protein